MDGRRLLVSLVLERGLSVSAAARELGVSRQTAYLWLSRAREDGIAGMAELSRRPKRSPCASPDWIVEAVLAASDRYPFWGPSKLHALLWGSGGAPVSERTVARILSRAGRSVRVRPVDKSKPLRFEKPHCNDMWQVDFKKIGGRKKRFETANGSMTRAAFASPARTFRIRPWRRSGTYSGRRSQPSVCPHRS